MFVKQTSVLMRLRCVIACVTLAVCAPMLASTLLQAQEQASLDDQYTLAAGFYSRGQWDDAEAAFTQLLLDHPRTHQAAAAAFFLPESQMQLGKFNEAYLAFQSFLKNHPEHPYHARAMFRMGESAYRTNQYDVAVRLLEEFVKSNPRHELNEFALPYLGQLRNLRNEPQLAQLAFETSLQLFPNGTLANRSRLGLAKALQDQSQKPGNVAEAKRFYDFLVEQNDALIAAEANVQIAILEFDQYDFEASEKRLRNVIESSSDGTLKAKATYWLARIQIEQQDYEQALEMLIPLAAKQLEESLLTSIWFDGSVAAVRANRDSLALDWLRRIRKAYPNSKRAPMAIRLEIDLLRKLDRLEEAVDLATTYQVEDKKAAVKQFALESQARKHYEAGDYTAAIRDFDLLIESVPTTNEGPEGEPSIANWKLFKALAQIGKSDFESAQTTLKQIDTNNVDGKLQGMIVLALGTCQFATTQYTQAAESYRRYLDGESDPIERDRVLVELAICHAKLGDVPDSDRYLGERLSEGARIDEAVEVAIEILVEAAISNHDSIAKKWVRYLKEFGQNETRTSRVQLRLAFAETGKFDETASAESFLTLLKHRPKKLGEQDSFDRTAIAQAAIAHANRLEGDDIEGAKQIYRCVIDESILESTSNIARLRLARIFQSEGGREQLIAAKKHLEAFVQTATTDEKSRPLLDEALYQLGWLAYDLGDRIQSESHFSNLVEKHSDSKYWSDAAYRIMQNRVDADDAEGAKRAIEAILVHQKEHQDVPQEILARVRFTQANLAVAEKNWPTVTLAMKSLESLPLSAELQAQRDYWLAEASFQQQEWDDALTRFEFVAKNPSLEDKHRPWVQLRIAQVFAQRNEWTTVEGRSREGLDQYPQFSSKYEFHYLIARALERRGMLDDAIEAFQKVIEAPSGGSTETAAMAQWRIGECLFHQEKFADAIHEYYKVHSLYDYPKWQSAALVQAGKCQEMLQSPSRAVLLYRRLLTDFPTSIYVQEAQSRLAKIQSSETSNSQRTANQKTEPRKKQ